MTIRCSQFFIGIQFWEKCRQSRTLLSIDWFLFYYLGQKKRITLKHCHFIEQRSITETFFQQNNSILGMATLCSNHSLHMAWHWLIELCQIRLVYSHPNPRNNFFLSPLWKWVAHGAYEFLLYSINFRLSYNSAFLTKKKTEKG